MKATLAPTIKLVNGVEMPQLGLGTWPMKDAEASVVVQEALRVGYRLVDTAENYENERGVGEGIHNSGVNRKDIFVTTKFNRKWHSIKGAKNACKASLERMRLDYIDLLLIHWPNPDQGTYVEAFEGLIELLKEGLVRSIGTSNFEKAHLQRLFDLGYLPHVNQIQLDPYHCRDELIAVHKAKGITTETWRPLGFGSSLLEDPKVIKIANSYDRRPAQIVLRWAVQQGYVTVPKTSNLRRMVENINIFDFILSESDMRTLDTMHRPDPKMLNADSLGH